LKGSYFFFIETTLFQPHWRFKPFNVENISVSHENRKAKLRLPRELVAGSCSSKADKFNVWVQTAF
jgi:hypothetical protein